MKALTIWQCWASLIILGAKRFEFRHWDYRSRYYMLEGERIVIHAATRPIKTNEVLATLYRIRDGHSDLDAEIAKPLLERVLAHHGKGVLELSAGLGTAILGRPKRATALFGREADDDIWAWPLTDIEKWDEPVPRKGHQGFWNWS